MTPCALKRVCLSSNPSKGRSSSLSSDELSFLSTEIKTESTRDDLCGDSTRTFLRRWNFIAYDCTNCNNHQQLCKCLLPASRIRWERTNCLTLCLVCSTNTLLQINLFSQDQSCLSYSLLCCFSTTKKTIAVFGLYFLTMTQLYGLYSYRVCGTSRKIFVRLRLFLFLLFKNTRACRNLCRTILLPLLLPNFK